MSNYVSIIRIRAQVSASQEIIKHVEEGLRLKTPKYYNWSSKDIENHNTSRQYDELCDKLINQPIIFVVYSDKIISKIYIGQCINLCSNERGISFQYQICHKVESQPVVTGICSLCQLDMQNDYDDGSYIDIECSSILYQHLDFLIKPAYICSINDKQTYEKKEAEEKLSPLAQKNEYCKRIYGIFLRKAAEVNFNVIMKESSIQKLSDVLLIKRKYLLQLKGFIIGLV